MTPKTLMDATITCMRLSVRLCPPSPIRRRALFPRRSASHAVSGRDGTVEEDEPASRGLARPPGYVLVMQSWELAPEWVPETVDRCLHDMQQPSVINLRLKLSIDDAVLMLTEPDGGGGGFSFSYAEPGPEVMVPFAGFLQDHVFPESLGAWGQALPACAGHHHPAKPTVLDGEAWWICPDTRQRLSPIGSYEHPVDERRRRSPRSR
jgi:hypothetical protein